MAVRKIIKINIIPPPPSWTFFVSQRKIYILDLKLIDAKSLADWKNRCCICYVGAPLGNPCITSIYECFLGSK